MDRLGGQSRRLASTALTAYIRAALSKTADAMGATVGTCSNLSTRRDSAAGAPFAGKATRFDDAPKDRNGQERGDETTAGPIELR